MSDFLVPVGHDLGPRVLDEEQYEFQVRVGLRVHRLDSLSFAIWLLAHDSERGLPDRTGVVDATTRLGLGAESAAQALAGLLTDGLLVEIGAEPESARGFAETHQLLPLMVGLGSDTDDPELRVVGLLDIPVVHVSGPMYELWMRAHLEPHLWAACQDVADVGRLDPDRVLSEVLAAVHPLLASRAAYLDLRREAVAA